MTIATLVITLGSVLSTYKDNSYEDDLTYCYSKGKTLIIEAFGKTLENFTFNSEGQRRTHEDILKCCLKVECLHE